MMAAWLTTGGRTRGALGFRGFVEGATLAILGDADVIGTVVDVTDADVGARALVGIPVLFTSFKAIGILASLGSLDFLLGEELIEEFAAAKTEFAAPSFCFSFFRRRAFSPMSILRKYMTSAWAHFSGKLVNNSVNK